MKQINRNAANMMCLCVLSMTPWIATRSASPSMALTITDQVQTVSGTVTDGSEPIIGATVKVKDTKDLGVSPTSTATSPCTSSPVPPWK